VKLLARHEVRHGNERRHLELYEGNLAAIPPSERVDVLVISAFPGDYTPTRTSLVGALHERGISVESIATQKEEDLLESMNCWLSKDLTAERPDAGFARLLCFEPPRRADPAELVGDLFRAIMPFALNDNIATRTIAAPLLAAGDQGHDRELMLVAIFKAATEWFARGLPIDVFKLVVLPKHATSALQLFRNLCAVARVAASPVIVRPTTEHGEGDAAGVSLMEPGARARQEDGSRGRSRPIYDCFISYSRSDGEYVDALVRQLGAAKPDLRVYQDKLKLRAGASWQSELDRVIETCRKVIAVYSPKYLKSRTCIEEFNMARLRHRKSQAGVLLPLYLRTAALPLYMQSLEYVDCREADRERMMAATPNLVAAIATC
jgi:hypothetical protein